MRRLILTLTLALMGCVPMLAGTIPVTGTIRTPDGKLFNGSVKMTLSYPGRDSCSSNIVVPTSINWRVQNGTIQSGALITPNDCIEPGNTVYLAEYFTAAGMRVMQNPFYVSGQSFNLGTATPTTLTTSNISFSDFGNLTNVSTAKLNNTETCVRSGATADVKIRAAIAALPSTGGIVDCTDLQGAQTISGLITIDKPVTLLLGYATFTMTKGILITSDGVVVAGKGPGKTTLFVAAGMAFADNDPILAAYGGTYPSPTTTINNTHINSLTIDGNQANLTNRPYANDTHGNGININRASKCRVTDVEVKNIVWQGVVVTNNNTGATGCEVDHNWVTQFGEFGIGVESISRQWSVHENIITLGLTTAETSGGSIGIYAASLNADVGGANNDDGQINDNIIYSVTNAGIVLQDGAHRTSVHGNTISTAANCIALLYTTDDSRVIRDVSIQDNTCRNASSSGSSAAILVSGPSTNKFEGISIRGNKIIDSGGAAVIVQNAFEPVIAGNTIRVTGSVVGSRDEGIFVATARSPQIFGNMITDGGEAINISGAGVTDAVVSNNYLYGNSPNGITDTGTRTVDRCNWTSTTVGCTNSMPVFRADGTPILNPHMIVEQQALSSGTATINFAAGVSFTSTSTYFCFFANNTADRDISVQKTTGGRIDLGGTGSDQANVACVGN